MKDYIGAIIGLTIMGSIFMGWITSLAHSIMTSDVIWLLVTIFLPPIGALRGICLWFM